MSRISIEVSPEEHQKLKALAALQGKSMKAFVMERLLPEMEEAALDELENLLDERIAHHQSAGTPGKSSARAIFDAEINQGQ
jgi:uncharacterized protein (DUF1778 family)